MGSVRILRPSSEEEMIAVFLSQEYESRERYADYFDAALTGVGASAELVTSLNLDDEETTVRRRKHFAE